MVNGNQSNSLSITNPRRQFSWNFYIFSSGCKFLWCLLTFASGWDETLRHKLLVPTFLLLLFEVDAAFLSEKVKKVVASRCLLKRHKENFNFVMMFLLLFLKRCFFRGCVLMAADLSVRLIISPVIHISWGKQRKNENKRVKWKEKIMNVLRSTKWSVLNWV